MRSRRRKLIVNRSVQGGLIARILFHWLIFFAATFCVLPLWQLLLSGDPLSPFGKEMLDMWVHSGPVFVILLALLPVFVWDTVKLTHRLAGPMYRFHKTVQQIAAGETVKSIKLRKGDAWTDFAADFNRMLDYINSSDQQQTASTDADAQPPSFADYSEPSSDSTRESELLASL